MKSLKVVNTKDDILHYTLHNVKRDFSFLADPKKLTHFPVGGGRAGGRRCSFIDTFLISGSLPEERINIVYIKIYYSPRYIKLLPGLYKHIDLDISVLFTEILLTDVIHFSI